MVNLVLEQNDNMVHFSHQEAILLFYPVLQLHKTHQWATAGRNCSSLFSGSLGKKAPKHDICHLQFLTSCETFFFLFLTLQEPKYLMSQHTSKFIAQQSHYFCSISGSQKYFIVFDHVCTVNFTPSTFFVLTQSLVIFKMDLFLMKPLCVLNQKSQTACLRKREK